MGEFCEVEVCCEKVPVFGEGCGGEEGGEVGGC